MTNVAERVLFQGLGQFFLVIKMSYATPELGVRPKVVCNLQVSIPHRNTHNNELSIQ